MSSAMSEAASIGRVLVATRSAGKLRELQPMFSAHGVSVATLDDVGIAPTKQEDALEVHETFEANALAKAQWFFAVQGSGLVVADDSGLEVDALDGAPGVRSKRWSGRTDLDGPALDAVNNTFLQSRLEQAAALGRPSRRARYVCAAAAVWPGGSVVVRGETCGEISVVAEGSGGFGYDPYFRSDDLGMSFGVATREEKGRVSHRGRAFSVLVRELVRRGVLPPAGVEVSKPDAAGS